ncbi:hypothetical protein [Alicyclobacillus fastidiosus]|uniref:Uncharacterized protein n=1 Tax=Alicyclobacillus fastidiosus TaxID=392011 RepID=A0ABV5AMF2_9BACL
MPDNLLELLSMLQVLSEEDDRFAREIFGDAEDERTLNTEIKCAQYRGRSEAFAEAKHMIEEMLKRNGIVLSNKFADDGDEF